MVSTASVRAPVGEGSWIGHDTGDGARGRRDRAREQRPTARALPTLEVPIARRDRKLTGAQLIAIHGDTHRASRFSPLGTRVEKHPIETLCFSRSLDSA
jgi:hypothetical protein